jgi:hypothetical protein
MSRVEAATGMDRLPWLADEPKVERAHPRGGGVPGLALATVVVGVGGLAFWFGAQSVEEQAPPASTPPRATTTVRLPAPRPAAPVQPQVRIEPVPEIEPIVAPPMPIIESPPVSRHEATPPVSHVVEKAISTPHPTSEPAPAVEEAPTPARPEYFYPWPVRVIDGAAGRLVRIGAFSSVHQAKRGWWAIVRVNPTLKHLPALIVPVQSLRNGRVYYRLQMGTTSQAHSTVLCQRMRMIAEPCVVIGLAA